MDVWGLMLNCVGAVLIATGQEIVTRVTDMWLRAHEAFLVSLGSRDVQRSECSGLLIKSDQVTRCDASCNLGLTTDVLDSFPFLECSFDRQKILMFRILGMLFHGSASPSKSSAPSGTNRVFRKNLGQRFGELLIKNGNIGATGHDFVASQRLTTKTL
jgi:hypothetical protein